LKAQELSEVLAHEFGHFSQGFGMRATYLIRSVNFWFTKVVYHRD
jgi:Zn-dependent protease with chaperone function